LPETTFDHLHFVTESLFGFAKFIFEFLNMLATKIFQFNILQIMPVPLFGIQIRSIARQLFEVNSLSGFGKKSEKVL
jgi:hypothetical protein